MSSLPKPPRAPLDPGADPAAAPRRWASRARVVLGSLALWLLAGVAAAQDTRPNLLVVLLDDVGVDKLGAYGEHPDAGPTPVMDLIAERGVLFRNAWSTPVCSPARASALTGRLPRSHGVGVSITSGGGGLAASELSLAAWLGTHGYRTAAIGKWHLVSNTVPAPWMHPITWGGFETHVGSRQNIGDYSSWARWVVTPAGGDVAVSTTYATTQTVDDALTAIRSFGEDPWFVWFAPHAVHEPLHDPPAHLHTGGDVSGAPADVQYSAVLEALDTELGRLLRSLRPAVRDRTYVVVMGDNGTYQSASTSPFGGPGNGKGTVKEGGVRVPLLVVGPDVVPGENPALFHIVDLFPTLVELAGVPLPTDVALDGVSQARLLRAPVAGGLRDTMTTSLFKPNGFGPYTTHDQAARDERYKLILRGGILPPAGPPERLYDLWEDPFEQVNLLLSGPLSREQAAALARLRAELD